MKNKKLLIVSLLGLTFGAVFQVEAVINFKITNETNKLINFKAEPHYKHELTGDIRREVGTRGGKVDGRLEKSKYFAKQHFSATLTEPIGDPRGNEYYELTILLSCDDCGPLFFSVPLAFSPNVVSVNVNVREKGAEIFLEVAIGLGSGKVKKMTIYKGREVAM